MAIKPDSEPELCTSEKNKEGILSIPRAMANFLAKNLRIQTFLRFLGIPLQRFIDKPGDTHKFLTTQGIIILKNDGWTNAAGYFNKYINHIINGNFWADLFWKNATHHYNPNTGHGLWVWPSAVVQCKIWFKISTTAWSKKKYSKSLFFLGACIHLVQDTCQPYHSNCIILDGHQRYESWVDINKQKWAIYEGGQYDASDTPEGWVRKNAEFSHSHLSNLTKNNINWCETTKNMIEMAQRTTAGFLLYFFRTTCIGIKTSAGQ